MNQEWKEQLEEHRNKRKEDIIEAAQQLFLERGISSVKLNDIVKLCGISKVTFYKYYKSLDEIIFAVQLKLVQGSNERFEEMPKTGKNGLEKLENILRPMTTHLDTNSNYFRFIALFDAYYREKYPTPELENAYLEQLKKGRSGFQSLLLEGMKDGSIRNDIDVNTLQYTISNITTAMMQRMALRGKLLQYDQGVESTVILEQMVNMIVSYLNPPK